MLRWDLSALSRRQEYLARIAQFAAERPEDEWILGGGWQMSAFPGGTPTAEVQEFGRVFERARRHHATTS